MRLDKNQVSLWEKGKFVISKQEKRELFLFDCRIHDKKGKQKEKKNTKKKAVEKQIQTRPQTKGGNGQIYASEEMVQRLRRGKRSLGVSGKVTVIQRVKRKNGTT